MEPEQQTAPEAVTDATGISGTGSILVERYAVCDRLIVERYAVGDRLTEDRVTRLAQLLVQAGWTIQHQDSGRLDDGTPARCLWMWKEPTAAEVQP